MPVTEKSVETFLQRYGAALGAGDVETVVECWETPAFVVSGQGSLQVETPKQIKDFFAAATKDYNSKGIVATSPTIRRVDILGPRIAVVDATWVNQDADGQPRSEERSEYVLREDDKGGLHICVGAHADA